MLQIPVSFPPKVGAIIGGLSAIAQAHDIEIMRNAGVKEVVLADIKDPTLPSNIEVARRADIIFVDVFPMERAWPVLEEIQPHVRPGAMVLTGSSVPIPRGYDARPTAQGYREKNVLLGYKHLNVGARAVRRGRSVAMGFFWIPETAEQIAWERFSYRFMAREEMMVYRMVVETHDQWTAATQGAIFSAAVALSAVMKQLPGRLRKLGVDNITANMPLDKGERVGGLPTGLILKGLVGAMGYLDEHQLEVNMDVVFQQVYADVALDIMIETLWQIKQIRDHGTSEDLYRFARQIRPALGSQKGQLYLARTYRILTRADSDMRAAHAVELSPEQNKEGALLKALSLWSRSRSTLTTQLAQDLAPESGGAVFVFGTKHSERLASRQAYNELLRMGYKPFGRPVQAGHISNDFLPRKVAEKMKRRNTRRS